MIIQFSVRELVFIYGMAFDKAKRCKDASDKELAASIRDKTHGVVWREMEERIEKEKGDPRKPPSK